MNAVNIRAPGSRYAGDTGNSRFEEALAAIPVIAEAAFASGDFAPLHDAFVAAVALASSGADLWRLAASEPFDEVFFSEDELVPRQLEAILDRAFDAPDDVAAALALACRATAIHPGRPLLDDEQVGLKPELAALLASRRDRLHALAASPHRAVRVAALHALACCRVRAGARDDDPEVLASSLLALPSVEVARRYADHAHLLVQTCAIAAMARAGEVVSPSSAEVLARALDEAAPLPPEWGWRWAVERDTTAELAVRILRTAVVAEPSRAQLAAAVARANRRRPIYLAQEAALRIGFGEPFDPPRLGYALEDLGEAQRAALSTLANDFDVPRIQRFGLHLGEDVAPFLAGTGALWKPLAVGARRWHAVRIWREVLAGGLDEEEAARAIVEGLDGAELSELLGHRRRWVLVSQSRADVAMEARDARFAHRLRLGRLERLVADGDYDRAIAELRASAERDVDLLMDAMGIAERGAHAAREAGRHEAALDLLRLAHQANVVWASMSTSGAEGMQRMLDVDRLAALIRRWES